MSILKLLHLSLTRNEFDGKFYLQIKGTEMGKKFVPAYADIYMVALEETIFPKCNKLPLYYFWYLDDIWGVWLCSEDGFRVFVGTLNSHHSSINMTAMNNNQELS